MAAWTGMICLLPYVVTKTYWAAGGRVGLPDGCDIADEFVRNGAPAALVWLERHGVDFTAGFAALGAALLLALVAPWGLRLPRMVLLVPAGLGTVLFLPYGILTAVAAVAGVGASGPLLTTWIITAGVMAFCGVGGALAVCGWSYHRRTRSR